MRQYCARVCVLLTCGLLGAQAVRPSPSETQDKEAALARRIDHVVHKVQQRQLRSDQHTPWVIMHAAIAFKSDAVVFDTASGEGVEAIEYLLTRAKHEGRSLFQVVDGTPTVRRDPAVEHHVNQYLMMLALAGVSPQRALLADTGEQYRVAQLIDAAKLGFEDEQEVGWTLVALSVYLSLADEWVGANGRTYTIATVLRRGMERDPRKEAEGGTHHLFGISYAVRTYARNHGSLDGVWEEAMEYLNAHVATVRRFQLDDGAFSAGMLNERSEPKSPSELVFSTGHTLEWLALAMPGDQLRLRWVEHAVVRLCAEIERHPLDAFSDGGIYHAVNALRLYRDAVRREEDRPD